jgi:thiamine-monophosphate kinase
MKLDPGSEFGRIERLRAAFAADAPGVVVGIGDDAALLDPGAGPLLVWTVDEQVQNTHFDLGWLTLDDVAYRGYMAAASDLAAMGASPWTALASWVIPSSFDEAAFDALARGAAQAAAEVGAPIVGGNLAKGERLSLGTTLLGRTTRPLRRDGAKAGDLLMVAGPLGLAALGLRALQVGEFAKELEPALAAWRRPRARMGEGKLAGAVASAAIDISDGLGQDLAHLAQASGVQLVVEEAALRAHGGEDLARGAQRLGLEAMDLALAGGEDYALVVTHGAGLPGFTVLGHVRECRSVEDPSVILRSPTGQERPAPTGFDHFYQRPRSTARKVSSTP